MNKIASVEGKMIVVGVLLMLLGDFMFALNDAMGKWLVQGFSVGQVLLLRSAGAFILLAPLLYRQRVGDLFQFNRPWLQFARIITATGDTGLFYAAVVYLPLADVLTYYMAAPIYVAVISHFFLNERLGWRRWLAIAVGFSGVIIALRPSTAMLSLSSLYAILGSLCFTFTIILSRVLRYTSEATLVTWQTVGALVIGGALTIGHWNTPNTIEWGALILLGVVASLAHIFIARALKMAPASLLAPLQYTLLLWGIVFGAIFFGHYPDTQVLVGAGIIIVAGLFIFHRKKVRTREKIRKKLAKRKKRSLPKFNSNI